MHSSLQLHGQDIVKRDLIIDVSTMDEENDALKLFIRIEYDAP